MDSSVYNCVLYHALDLQTHNMPAFSDILQFMRGQLLETPTLPKTSFAGKTVVITGANQGLGFECAKQVYVVLGQLPIFPLVVSFAKISPAPISKRRSSYSDVET